MKTDRITGIQYTFLIISRSVRLNMRDVSDKIVEKIQINLLYSVNFFPPKIVPFMV